MSRKKIPASIRQQVAEKASHRCSYCQGPAIVGIPMVMEHIIPNTQDWREHFIRERGGLKVVGKTACGRATIAALRLNSSWQIRARRIWMLIPIAS